METFGGRSKQQEWNVYETTRPEKKIETSVNVHTGLGRRFYSRISQ